jgi:hypothetical protein
LIAGALDRHFGELGVLPQRLNERVLFSLETGPVPSGAVLRRRGGNVSCLSNAKVSARL